mmetsp:Transcript_679/g.1435  ORF Transcript_679/g.1435 Transcript_679/m.1435 type:complete len:367 (-) Transcript_679:329-1429(-)
MAPGPIGVVDGELGVATVSPSGSPRVLHVPVLLAVLSSVPDDADGVAPAVLLAVGRRALLALAAVDLLAAAAVGAADVRVAIVALGLGPVLLKVAPHSERVAEGALLGEVVFEGGGGGGGGGGDVHAPPVAGAVELVAVAGGVLGVSGEPVTVAHKAVVVPAVPHPGDVVLRAKPVTPHVVYALADPAAFAASVPAEDVRGLAGKVADRVSGVAAAALPLVGNAHSGPRVAVAAGSLVANRLSTATRGGRGGQSAELAVRDVRERNRFVRGLVANPLEGDLGLVGVEHKVAHGDALNAVRNGRDVDSLGCGSLVVLDCDLDQAVVLVSEVFEKLTAEVDDGGPVIRLVALEGARVKIHDGNLNRGG